MEAAILTALKGLLGGIMDEAVFDLIKTGLTSFFKTMKPADVKVLKAKLGAPSDLEDEQIFQRAEARLQMNDGNAHSILLARLQALAIHGKHVNNLYRLIVVGEANPDAKDKIADTARRVDEAYQALYADAYKDDATWDAYVHILGIRENNISGIATGIRTYANGLVTAITNLSETIENETKVVETGTAVSNWLDARIKQQLS